MVVVVVVDFVVGAVLGITVVNTAEPEVAGRGDDRGFGVAVPFSAEIPG